MTAQCSRCGTDLPPDSVECPACLLALAFASDPTPRAGEEPTVSAPGAPAVVIPRGPHLIPGQIFGPYRIERLLGIGGMGEVYEAEHIEYGRRVALKVLNQGMTDPEDRARFLREGQLAASVIHQNSVYIYGSEEISGTPVISMELLAGGTLKDRVAEHGRLAVREAVDAILQVVAGLEAAQGVGVLHRDIKPSNCFVDADGTVKIGDFGLSISTLSRDVTQLTITGAFHGTPQFAPPEQIRGEPLDIRADIYAVGATLYYLLTAHAPFEESDLLALVARVTGDEPRSPIAYESSIPRGLARTVLRCLSKRREDRPANYSDLAEALLPFSSAVPQAAALGPRLAAGAVDLGVVFAAQSFVRLLVYVPTSNFIPSRPRDLWLIAAFAALYFSIGDRARCSTLGKALCGLTVVDWRGDVPSLLQTFMRAAVFSVVLFLPVTINGGWTQTYFAWRDYLFTIYVPSRAVTAAVLLSTLTGMALIGLFLPARRRNLWAGLHDLASRTRCVARRRHAVTSSGPRTSEWASPAVDARYIGPYRVDVTGKSIAGFGYIGAFDDRLKRQVWIHGHPAGTPPLPPSRRQLSRPTRLRWLNGRRAATECWDAYQAPDGAPLTRLLDRTHAWEHVRDWLHDLAHECAAVERDQSLPTLPKLSELWITASGRLKVLEPTPRDTSEVAHGSKNDAMAESQQLIAQIALATLGMETSSRRPPVAVHATKFVDDLRQGRFRDPDAITARLRAVEHMPAVVTRRVRAQLLLCTAVLPMFAIVWGVGRIGSSVRYFEIQKVFESLRDVYDGSAPPPIVALQPALEVYLSAYSPDIVVPADVSDSCFDTRNRSSICAYIVVQDRARANRPRPPWRDRAGAVAALEPLLGAGRWSLRSALREVSSGVVEATAACVVLSLIALVVFRRSPLLRLLRVELVRSDGFPASLGRRLVRWLVVWAPALPTAGIPIRAIVLQESVFAFLVRSQSWNPIDIHDMFLAIERVRNPIWTTTALMLLVMTAGAIEAMWHPSRSLADRLAGTWLVPE